jgi:DNA-binding NarL/FixJ family response regulator
MGKTRRYAKTICLPSGGVDPDRAVYQQPLQLPPVSFSGRDIFDRNRGRDLHDGLEATRKIHSKFPHIRIIVLSVYGDQEIASAVLNAGAAAFLTKSGNADSLLAAIRQARRSSLRPAKL